MSYLFCGQLVVQPLAIPSTSFTATDKPKHKKKDAKGDSKKINEISPGCIVEVALLLAECMCHYEAETCGPTDNGGLTCAQVGADDGGNCERATVTVRCWASCACIN